MLLKIYRQRGDHFVAAGVRSELAHRDDRLRKAARNDVLEVAQIGRMIQSKAVRRDPAADVNADGGDLFPVHPYAGAALQPPGIDFELRERIGDDGLDRPHIRDYVALPFSQIEDGIADNLAGAVISNIAAAIRGMECDSGAAQNFFARKEI